ncbi:gluzincin family metallopeptidase [Roseimaritima sediminicola]|uniref:hypothetical protein n=1 Tax=Roseimaritima sediminicola TaxID=2662066 RepID=UPI0012984C0B|nr:hypothetical protein [Roseimaritima sediminicola]
MDATKSLRTVWANVLGLVALALCLGAAEQTALGQASVRTQNFVITAPDAVMARQVGEAAERYRRDLADYWLGYELSPWPQPCPIRVVSGPNLAAQGVTHYDIQPVRNFRMEVVGTPQRILDSVLPHEVSHTILATHFGRPLPRWADEGVCTIVEHESEKSKHEAHLRNFLRTERGIAMNKLFLLREYPDDIHPMYAQGYSVCRFLIEQQGPRTFIEFLEHYHEHPSWTDTVREFYGYDSLAELQQYWLKWVSDGSGSVDRYVKRQPRGATDNVRLASGESPAATAPEPLPRGAATPLRDGPATRAAALAAAENRGSDGDSWYLRRREAVASDDSSPAAAATATPRPPHTAAQPQPEQRMAPAALWPAGRARTWR